jgi:hypothetical protein
MSVEGQRDGVEKLAVQIRQGQGWRGGPTDCLTADVLLCSMYLC